MTLKVAWQQASFFYILVLTCSRAVGIHPTPQT